MQETPLDVAFHPELIAPGVFIAPQSIVRGQVHIGKHSSVWFGAVIRGDTVRIEIGESTNVQDQAVLHGDPGYPCLIGNRVTIGHGAIVHGAQVDDEVLIGMRAVILNGAVIGKHCIIGAGAIIPEGKHIPPCSLVLGVPAKIIREVNSEDVYKIQHAADHYVRAALSYQHESAS